MNLMFWKKKADAADEPEVSGTDEPDLETPAEPGLAAKMKLWLGGLASHFKRTPTFRAEAKAEAPEDEYLEGEPARSRKRLIIGGAVAVVVLLLAGIGVALWPSSERPQEQLDTRPAAAAATPGAAQPASAPQVSPNEIEALRKENAELQAKIEELKKGQVQQRPAAQATGASTPLSSIGGEMAVGSSDPKAAAMTLKEAIDAMNASSGDYRKKPAK